MSTQPSGDEFTDKMWQYMQLVNNEATKQINQLRATVRDLQRQLDAAKERYYVLQEQNVAMQFELEARALASSAHIAQRSGEK